MAFERNRQRLICEHLRKVPRLVYHVDSGGGGWPDLHVIHEGRHVLLELKNDGGRVKPHQRLCHHRIRHAGGEVYVPRTWSEVVSILGLQE